MPGAQPVDDLNRARVDPSFPLPIAVLPEARQFPPALPVYVIHGTMRGIATDVELPAIVTPLHKHRR
jgi:hypothetical protein